VDKVISIFEALALFPDFQPQWSPHHSGCPDPPSVVLGHPTFGIVRHVVVVQTDEGGRPIRPLYDKMQFDEGPVNRPFPGAIIVPWFDTDEEGLKVVLRRKIRPIRQTECLEFPQGYAEVMETAIETGARELLEETGLTADANSIWRLPDICPEPDWFSKGTAVVAIGVEFVPDNFPTWAAFPIDNLAFCNGIDSATTLAALTRFLGWINSL
jgi:8-oxo-dGTP pyrophosphatase MutT (NUDIX family)